MLPPHHVQDHPQQVLDEVRIGVGVLAEDRVEPLVRCDRGGDLPWRETRVADDDQSGVLQVRLGLPRAAAGLHQHARLEVPQVASLGLTCSVSRIETSTVIRVARERRNRAGGDHLLERSVGHLACIQCFVAGKRLLGVEPGDDCAPGVEPAGHRPHVRGLERRVLLVVCEGHHLRLCLLRPTILLVQHALDEYVCCGGAPDRADLEELVVLRV